MLELITDRSCVGGLHPGQRFEQSFARYTDAEDRSGNLRHQFGSEMHRLRIQGRVTFRLATERIKMGGEVPVGPVGLEQGSRSLYGLEQFGTGSLGYRAWRGSGCRDQWWCQLRFGLRSRENGAVNTEVVGD